MRLAAALVLALAAPAALGGTWVDTAPVLSARPVFTTSPQCHPEAARRLGREDLAASLREDLERARCDAESRQISGWLVTYRYAGREYERIFPKHPGRFIEVEVEVHAGAG